MPTPPPTEAAEAGPGARRDRLAQLLGPVATWLHPLGAMAAAGLLWILLGLLSGRWLAMAWSCWSLVLLATAMWLERPWLNVLPLPPVTVITLAGAMRFGLGAALMVAAGNHVHPGVEGWVRGLEPAQALWALVSTAIVLAALVNRGRIRRFDPAPLGAAVAQRLPLLALVLGLFSCGYLVVGIVSGTLDRSNANYLYWAPKLWRADTAFVPFLRLRDLFYLLVPPAVQVCLTGAGSGPQAVPGNGTVPAPRALAVVLIAMTIGSLALGALTGGRALLLAPLVLLLGGLWMTELRPRLLRWLALGVVAFALVFIPVMATLRDSAAFQASASRDLAQRGEVIGRALVTSRPGGETLSLLGRDLFPSSDPFLFHPPGSVQPPAGWRRLQGLLYLWVPKHLYPDRPQINDGHLIAKEIMGMSEVGISQGSHVWFPNVSFGGDLYWRFRWPGVLIGAALFGAFYALLCGLWYRWASLSASLYRLLIAVYPATFFNGVPLRSVSETFWNWFWDFPKYLLALLVVSWLVETLHRRLSGPAERSVPGGAG